MQKQTFNEWLIITESKENIKGLGYPEIIAKLFYGQFGNKHAYLISKWYRDYSSSDPTNNWWSLSHRDFYTISIVDLVDIYNSTNSSENYFKTLKKLELSVDDEDFVDLEEERESIKNQIKDKLFSNSFFRYNRLIEDLISGRLKDVSPYKNMNFWKAQIKYDEKNI